jgi:hypothetical protein
METEKMYFTGWRRNATLEGCDNIAQRGCAGAPVRPAAAAVARSSSCQPKQSTPKKLPGCIESSLNEVELITGVGVCQMKLSLMCGCLAR